MRPPPEIGDRWPKQARHTSQMDRLRMRGEELAVAAPARPSGRDGVMASPGRPTPMSHQRDPNSTHTAVRDKVQATTQKCAHTISTTTPTTLAYIILYSVQYPVLYPREQRDPFACSNGPDHSRDCP